MTDEQAKELIEKIDKVISNENEISFLERMYNKTTKMIYILITLAIIANVTMFYSSSNIIKSYTKDVKDNILGITVSAKNTINETVKKAQKDVISEVSSKIDFKGIASEVKEQTKESVLNDIASDINGYKKLVSDDLQKVRNQVLKYKEIIKDLESEVGNLYVQANDLLNYKVKIASIDTSPYSVKAGESAQIVFDIRPEGLKEGSLCKFNATCKVFGDVYEQKIDMLVQGYTPSRKAEFRIVVPKQYSSGVVQEGKYLIEIELFDSEGKIRLAQKQEYLNVAQ